MKRINSIIFKLFMVIMSVAMVIGACSHERKVQKAVNTLKEDTMAAAKFCHESFPPRTEYIKGKDSVRIDTLERLEIYNVPGDSVYKDSIRIQTKYIRITTTRVDTMKVPDSAGIKYEQLQADKWQKLYYSERDKRVAAEASASGWKEKAKERWWIILLIILSAVGIGAFKAKKKFWP